MLSKGGVWKKERELIWALCEEVCGVELGCMVRHMSGAGHVRRGKVQGERGYDMI